MFNKIPSPVKFPDLEAETLAFWDDHQIFEKSLEQRRHQQEFVFYDGPPFATGMPHYGHLLAGAIKDVIPRYQTMRGKYVERVFGWDCHGLPVENEMEKELGISSKHEIEAYGIHRFNEACRGIVLRYTKEWEQIVKRMGRWVDFRNGYRTMDTPYMESIWWVFKQLWQKELIYEGRKILPYCPRCATPLSNFEANQGYEDVDDPAITVRFRLTDEPNTFILAWTTTPWTLPANLALAVGEEIDYVKVRDGGQVYILARDRLPFYYRDGEAAPEIIATVKGRELINLGYQPLFPYFTEWSEAGAFRVLPADFVTTSDGTGIVHIAPGFGEDDARVGKQFQLPAVCPIDAECCYTAEIGDYAGRFVKDCDKEIIGRLKREGQLIHQATIHHSYPHCWRCEAPLIYRAISTWFVKVEEIKETLLRANQQITWMPGHLKDGRFGKWLENAHDWAISRNRYWGCPIPVWRNQDTGDVICVGSIAELETLSGQKITDIHKHFVDPITLVTATGTELKRVPEVLDCWFESGAMPYAQRHYPFANKEWLEAHFPADFIAEGLDQTRGWFYTLVVLGGALFNKPAFKNVIVNGLVLAEDGRKMSKRLKNYPDPEFIINTYGADALRLCLLSSPVVKAEDLRFSEHAVKDIIRAVILPLWNAYSFLVTYARVDDWSPTWSLTACDERLHNPLDRWILTRLQHLVNGVRESMDRYDLQIAAVAFAGFIDELTNWYIRRSRRRFWKSQNDDDKLEAYHTLYYVLREFCLTAAPFIPFITDAIYRNLRSDDDPQSVHLCDFPELSIHSDSQLDRRMQRVMRAVSLGRSLRSQANLKVRQPLAAAIVVSMDAEVRADLEQMKEIMAEELNVKEVVIDQNEERLVQLSAKANFKVLGPRLGKEMKAAAAAITRLTYDQVKCLCAGQSIGLDLSGENPLEISLNDIEIRRDERPGIAAANDNDITVALDMTMTEALEMEGWAREIVNRVQNLRKDLNLEVADRINITFAAPSPVAAAIEHFRGYIMGETLAEELIPCDAAQADWHAVILGAHEAHFAVEKWG